MKQRLACLVLIDLRDRIGEPSFEATAAYLCSAGVFSTSAAALAVFRKMIDAGSRYRNLETALGTSGVCLALGSGLSEGWYVPKSRHNKTQANGVQLDEHVAQKR